MEILVKETIARHLSSMHCVGCGGALAATSGALSCRKCGQKFPIKGDVPYLLDAGDRAGQEAAGHMEALFRFPSFYWLKIRLLLWLNKTDDLSLRKYLERQSVLDVGCGPFIYGYDAKLPKSIVGLDLSPQFVRAMSRHDLNNLYLVASARKIPFIDQAFNVSFLRYVIHHIPGDTGELLAEVARVTSGYLIIFDHVKSDVPWQRAIQTTYWKAFDSGHHYNTMAEWDALLRPYKVVAFRRTGRMFGNICQIILDLRRS
jgi:SAM-dependent methyltransferase